MAEVRFRPIGWWLRRLDQALTQRMNEALTGVGLTRPQWQALNLVDAGGADRAKVVEVMAPFLDPDGVAAVLGELEGRGLVTGDAELAMTAAGRELHSRAIRVVDEFRVASLRGIDDDEFQGTIATLDRMLDNLGWEPAEAPG